LDGHVSSSTIKEPPFAVPQNVNKNIQIILDLPPEMVHGLPYDFQVDVWSLGVMTYEMVTGYSPFYGDQSDVLENIKIFNGFDSVKDRLEAVCASGELLDFISRILVVDYSKRICIEDALKHPWIKLYN